MMRKKTQVQQAFIYIVAVIIIGFMLLMGFKYIMDFIEKKCDVEFYNFKTDIHNSITKHTALGEYMKERFNAPCDYESVCFVDARAIGDASFSDTNSILPDTSNMLIQDSVQKGVEHNIFLVKDTVEPIGFNPAVALSDQDEIFCIQRKSGNFNIAFRGKGLVNSKLMSQIETY